MSKLSFWKTLCLLCVFCVATAMVSPAQDEQPSTNSVTFTSLLSFDGTDGALPFYGSLVQGLDGNLYGTTSGGYGTVFKTTLAGTATALYSFCSQSNCTDGLQPFAGLALGTDGNFYGTTYAGGAYGDGTVFKVTPNGALTVVHSFDYTDGSGPLAGLALGPAGDFYGTTVAGGAYYNYGGTIFRITPKGTFTLLYSFCAQTNCTDGSGPYGGLVLAADGNFYGTTYYGGAYGFGTVFKVSPKGALTTLYSFCALGQNCTDGAYPQGGLAVGTDGNFYGTTAAGGGGSPGNYADGTVFRITAKGVLTTLYRFCSQTNCTDGFGPLATLALGTDGNFYGTTPYGGTSTACTSGCGTIFKITTAGALTTLHDFDGTDGSGPLAGPFQATNGTFYGTTYDGGADAGGTVFSLAVGLGPFAETVPTSGKVGTAVKILGNNLAGSTSVTFNGVPVTSFKASNSEITTTVPTGATTGYLTVTTPSGTLKSNVKFQVRP